MPFDSTIIPVILAGGSGTRLWPLSRAKEPKQFWPLAGDQSLFQQTLLRNHRHIATSAPLIMTHDDFRFLVAEQCRHAGIKPAAIMLETARRNTGIAMAMATLHVAATQPEAILFFQPADHSIRDDNAFLLATNVAIAAAKTGRVVTFGIHPTYPETGFGYIQLGEGLSDTVGAYQVARFVEKPNRPTAQQYLSSGQYVWNSGMFMARADVLAAEFERHAPDVARIARATLQAARSDLDFIRLPMAVLETAPDMSFDYAVMEKTRVAAVVPGHFEWSDIGSWQAMWDFSPKDEWGNALRGPTLVQDANQNFVWAGDRLVALLGVDDLVVVDTPDALLVAGRARAQQIKELVEKVRATAPLLASHHRKEQRPWGDFTVINDTTDCKVKRIRVMPGQKLSLQRHKHRSEHWLVLHGNAVVTRNNDVITLHEGQSIDIPQGAIHRLENAGPAVLEIIEVQMGQYFGEDDIERLDDV
ncbi:MAG: mannose-1-phosphate guanylyltransferase/mannose-6-phosphate isomerase, partial [Alphaproteobacteria bacterium]|nr:mannose-1-phosphate guanylyltransferase/mannose-6-phosphate isomerase [Alphaproteobacteria bacterium]